MKWLDVALIAVLVVSVLPFAATDGSAAAMSPQDEETEAEAAQAVPDASPAEADAGDEFEQVEQILDEEEEMIQGAYSYDAGRRRDPFISLLEPVGTREGPGPGGECPIGCLIDEITLTGVFVMPEGPVAQILSADQAKSYLIRVGDEFHDGEVIDITPQGVRFRQMVNDFQQMKPYREVFMELNP